MPRCQSCGERADRYSLRKVSDAVVCTRCSRPKAVEGNMAENKKQLLSVVLNEVPTPDGVVDHEVSIQGAYGGLELKYDTTFDKVRTFFTQKREEGRKAELAAVK